MPVNPIQLYESRTLLLKVETTAGVDAVPTGLANAMVTMEGTVAVEADKLERKVDLAYLGADPFVLIGKRATVEFDFDLIGASAVGTAAPCAPILKTCGMAEVLAPATSATYNPISSGFSTATIYFYHAGLLFKITYALGTIDVDFSVKSWPKAHAKYMGIISPAEPTEVAAPAVTLTAFQTPPAVETETFLLSCNAVALNATSFKLSQGNDVKVYEGSEARMANIADRKSTGSFSIYQEVLATFNPWSLANAHTQTVLFAEVGVVAGKIVRVTCGKAQLSYPKLSNADGAMSWDMEYSALPSSAGNDDFAIKFT